MQRSTTVGAAVVLAVAFFAAPATADDTQAGTEARAEQAATTDEYVVGFEPAEQAAAIEDIEAAGGTVVDINEAVGAALVTSGEETFLEDVRASDAIDGAARNHSIGTSRPGMPHRFVEERPDETARRGQSARDGARPGQGPRHTEPLADRQWDMAMIGATPDGAWRRATGRGVTVGIIDTGVDASHPDIAPNFDSGRSRNFTMDIPEIDGPCEVATCIDPANVDDGGHGTHVAGIVGANRNGIGIAGVAPEATLVNLRAGQDSGYFFLYETVAALSYAGEQRLDVVNMSFYTDPWLYNCDSADDYVEGTPTEEEIQEQAFIRETIIAALEYAHAQGVTLVGAAGNSNTDMSEPTRFDNTSPDYGAPPVERTVTNDCLDLPTEGPNVLTVSSVGPSTTKADHSNWGLGVIELSAPGGWFRDNFGTPAFMTPENMVLSSYPLHVAIAEGLANPDGTPTDDFSVRSCDSRGQACGFYTYLHGTSMASPHVAGVAALAIEAHGRGNRNDRSLAPDQVTDILLRSATDHACPVGGIEDYTDEGRPPSWNADCEGTTASNGIYGEGIVSATGAVGGDRH